MQFTAGALACAAVRKLDLSDPARRRAGYLSVLLVALVIAGLYFFDAHPLNTVGDAGGLVDLLFVPLMVVLAVGTGSLPALLSTRLLVYGGQISFGLYMVHELVHTAWIWTVRQFELTLTPTLSGKATLLGLLALSVLGAVLLFHIVEEPARRWMRRMVDIKPADPPSSADSPNRLHRIDGELEARPTGVSARAG
jgi:peptidoglycan/LPS O-acetylase OafA/YrhL